MQTNSPDPTFGNGGYPEHVRMTHHPGTHQVLKHGVGIQAPGAQHPNTNTQELVKNTTQKLKLGMKHYGLCCLKQPAP